MTDQTRLRVTTPPHTDHQCKTCGAVITIPLATPDPASSFPMDAQMPKGHGTDPTSSSETPEGERVDALTQRWYHVGRPWNDQPGLIYAGAEDPHAGTFVADCGSWTDELFFGERPTVNPAEVADLIVAQHNAALSADGWRVEPVVLREAVKQIVHLWFDLAGPESKAATYAALIAKDDDEFTEAMWSLRAALGGPDATD